MDQKSSKDSDEASKHTAEEHGKIIRDTGEPLEKAEETTLSFPVQEDFTVMSSTSTSNPHTVEESDHVEKIQVVLCEKRKTIPEETTESSALAIQGLSPGNRYLIDITVMSNDDSSEAAVTSAQTKTHIQSLLHDLELEKFYPNKLSPSNVLQIDRRSMTDVPDQRLSSVPWVFLKKLMRVNVTARDVKHTSDESDEVSSLDISTEFSDFEPDQADGVNPLDVVTALFLCSDSFLQQEMVSKMSMCQFSVPLLLPDCDTQRCTLMLWAMRDIVKKFRPHSLSDQRSFVEERIVHSEIPLVSFVRLGDCGIPKSQILNKLLSNPQQYHDTFIHREMDCGDVPRRISDGLVEMSWYLPCGNKNIDVFPEAVAVANLRGDLRSFRTQYSFLCQTSTAVFVFFDNLDTNCKLLADKQAKAQIFLVGNKQKKLLDIELLKKTAAEMRLKKNNIILKDKQNDAQFVKGLISTINSAIKQGSNKVCVEGMTSTARDLEIVVDEDGDKCQRARKNADNITNHIKDTLQFKEERLPRQGKIWKDLAKLEKEQFRLRKAGDQNLEMYKSDLQDKMTELRTQQRRHDMSPEIICFIKALSTSSQERKFFLKWMRMNLDNLSQTSLSSLRETYKEKCQQPEKNKEEIAKLDQQISNSSLGTEHFLRELGQIYEDAVSLPETSEEHKQMLHLPRLCAELMLEGFPLELVDGDASNVPLRWVSDVLKELNSMLQNKNKIMVVTVLGVQSTGKSTLLNTMFGVQFAVSSGRCTRGAFMQMIRVSEEYRKEVGCDFLLIIDTEGLKSPELTTLDDSYEHDNELATLVVGLSDITIINIAMENSTEMKDILQIVVHAFLRMKEIGKKPKCQFVHQNVADVSAHNKNMRDHKLLLEQLNKMTEAAAKMENKEKYRFFTDVMEYDPGTCNWYIPGLWHGNPPMAPVNAGYSETVYDLKKNMVELIGLNKHKTTSITEFLEWMRSLWNSVKFENFIFSFRNSLVADAYMKLCSEYNSWRWSFKKQMHAWLTGAETRVSNCTVLKLDSNRSDLYNEMRNEAVTKLDTLEKITMENISKYFDKEEGHVDLVEKYREDFVNSVKCLRNETERSVLNQLEVTVDIKRGMNKLDNIKKTFTDTMEKKVLMLLEELRTSSSQRSREMSEEKIEECFEQVWQETEKELSVSYLTHKDIYDSIFRQLRENMKQKGSSVAEKLNQINLKDCGKEPYKVTPEAWFKNFFNLSPKLQSIADTVIQSCEDIRLKMTERGSDYHDTYIQEILNSIDEALKSHKKISADFEMSLKLHICGDSARHFQLMHDRFITTNDPQKHLNQSKVKYCTDFKDLFHNRDQCQRKAEEFTTLCLAPAVQTYIFSSLGPDIVDKMMQGKNAFQFSTRAFFQFTLLKQLLHDDNFDRYVQYICSYEAFVKNWILDQIIEKFSGEQGVSELEEHHLKEITDEILKAVKKAQEEPNEGNVRTFIQTICRQLGEKLTLSTDALDNVMVLNNASLESFTHWLNTFVAELQQKLRNNLKEMKIQAKLQRLTLKPQDELFKRVFGCGKQCPFCKAPCEAGGEAHAYHCASVHRPQGLGQYRGHQSKKLVTEICSTNVHSDRRFKCSETNGEYHPYKKYREIFRDWHIPADMSIQASDYWKYVMAKFNEKFAKEYGAQPGEIPSSWKTITKGQAEESLKESFSIK